MSLRFPLNGAKWIALPALLLMVTAAGCGSESNGAQQAAGNETSGSNSAAADANSPAGNTAGSTEGNAATSNSPSGNAPEATEKPGPPGTNVTIETSMGTIEAVLYPEKAPISVKNFLAYAKKGHYNGTIFHRVIPGFMIQGGGYTKEMSEKPTSEPIKNEAGNGLKNERGTLAMARTGVVDSATSQFYINVNDNESLNHRSNDSGGFGYAVFGKVTKGMDVADKIVSVPTTQMGPMSDVPATPVLIQSVKVK